MHQNRDSGKIIIYYNISDIFLGFTLFALVLFFINDYLSHRLGSYNKENPDVLMNQIFPNESTVNMPGQNP